MSGLHAPTKPKCHESILFAIFAPCWHATKIIKKSTFWHPKIDILRVSVHILASWSARRPIPSCQEAKMPAFLVSWCQDTWLPGTWYLAVWSNTVRARGHLGDMVGFSPLGGGTPKIIKNRDFLAPCCHTAKMSRKYIICYICTMLAWYQKHQKINILASQNRYFRSLSAHLGFLECQNAHTELPRSQDAGFPGILVPRYLASRYLVSGSME